MTRIAWAGVAVLALAVCTVPPRAPDVGQVPDPGTLQRWSASGRLAVAAGDDGGSGAFDWRQDGSTTRLDLRGPLGAGAMRVEVTPGSLTLADGSGQVLDAAAAQAELQGRLGADLPWSQLRYWLLGIPAPGEEADVRNATAPPWRVIEQSGWRLAYDSFEVVGGLELPQRFSAQRGPVRVRVIVDSWSAIAQGGEVAEGAP